MFQYVFLENDSADKVGGTVPSVTPIVGAYKVILPFLKVACRAVVQLFPIVGTSDDAREHIAFSRSRRAAFVPA